MSSYYEKVSKHAIETAYEGQIKSNSLHTAETSEKVIYDTG